MRCLCPIPDISCPEPLSRPSGGRRAWSGSRGYGASVSYDCGPHAAFVDQDLGARVESFCRWDETWSLDELPQCMSESDKA